MICWGITDGGAGMVSQVKALAAAIGIPVEMKKIAVKAPWSWWPNWVYTTPLSHFIVPYFLKAESDAFAPVYPDVVISCGRRAAMVAMGLQTTMPSATLGMTKFIHIHDPKVGPKHFDLVVTVDHDAIDGPNVLKTRFALHAVTPAALQEAAQRFTPRFAHYPQLLTAVLLGGSTHRYTLTQEAMAQLVLALQQLLNTTRGSLLITPSRRTGEENIAMLRQVFSGNDRVYIYDFKEENPYMGMLALADTIIVTNDSVNMMSDAAATGKPIYILRLPGHTDSKPARFAEKLITDGIARALAGKLERWDYVVENEMETLAEEIRQRLSL